LVYPARSAGSGGKNALRTTRQILRRFAPKDKVIAMAVNDADFKHAMSHFASGVTIVTTENDGKPFGMTVSSFASLSLHPPLVLVCVEKSLKTHDAITSAGRFGVSILGTDQAHLSNRFASRIDDKFEGVETERGELGVPLIANALTTLECHLHSQLSGGDHTIFVGEVASVRTREGSPLVYYRAGYRDVRL
jgi:flavin reductase (DIM6/NTAB) family NADH-FMN oxidoreductase RutF